MGQANSLLKEISSASLQLHFNPDMSYIGGYGGYGGYSTGGYGGYSTGGYSMGGYGGYSMPMAPSNVVHAIIPTTINHLREEVFERGGEQRGGEAKEEKEGIKEDQQEEGQQEEGQQEEKVSNEPFNR